MNSKNKKTMIAISFFFVLMGNVCTALCVTNPSYMPLKLNPTHIVKAAKEARQTVHDHRVMYGAMVAVTAGKKLVEIYTLVNSFGEKPQDPQDKKPDDGAPKSEQGFFERVGKGFSDGWNCVTSPASWGNGMVWMGKQVPTIMGLIVTDVAIRQLVAKVQHEDSLLWFRNRQTTYTQTMLDVIACAKKLEENKGSQQDWELNKALFIQATKDMVTQIEKIVGYMYYKKPQLEDKAQVATEVMRHTLRIANALIKELNKKIGELHKQSMYKEATGVTSHMLLEEFNSKFNELIDAFAQLDEDSYTERHHDRVKAEQARRQVVA